MSGRIKFGAALLEDSHAALRRAIADALRDVPDSAHVDTLFAPPTPRQNPQWIILLDVCRIFAYWSAGIADVAGLVLDDYPFPNKKALADAAYRFIYPHQALSILPVLLRKDGAVGVCNLRTGEVTRAIPYSTANPDPAPQLESSPALDDSMIGADWRAGDLPCVDGIVSKDLGIIRAERLYYSFTAIPTATARVVWSGGREEAFCGGRSVFASEAKIVARLEALERFQAAHPPPGADLVHGSYRELAGRAIDPRSLFFPDSRKAPVDELSMYWTRCLRVLSSEQVLVPAQEVWIGTSRLPHERMRIRPTTNGCAVGRSVAEAALFAFLELIERDAYLIMWYSRKARNKIRLDSIQDETVQLLLLRLRHELPGYSWHVFDVRSDIPIPAVAAVALREFGEGPKTLHAAAARPDLARAVATALKDIAGSFDGWKPGSKTSPEQSALAESAATSPDDHRAFYARDDNFEALAFLDFESPGTVTAAEVEASLDRPRGEKLSSLAELSWLAGCIESCSLPALVKDITHPCSKSRGIFCAKAVIPGAFPIWYGLAYRRFSLTARLRISSRELTGKELDEKTWNRRLHPFG